MTADSIPQTPFAVSAPVAPDIPETVARLRTTFASGRTRSVEWRKQQLKALAAMVSENEAAIGAALEQDLGRKPFEAWLVDIAPTVGEAKDAERNVGKWMRRKHRILEMSQLPGRGWIEYEPYGTVLVIGAWNFPIVLTLGPAVAAIAAGNTVVLKPSEAAPASSAVMAGLVAKYLDNDAVAVIEGDGAVSQELIAQGFDRLLFTGGIEIGRKVYQAAATHLTPVTLELGGKSPVIVAEDAEVDVAAKRIAWTKLINSGQTCIAPDYVLVDAKVRDSLVDKIKDAVTTFEADNPGGRRIVNQRHFDRLTAAVAATKGTIAIGGGWDASAMSIQPTVVVDPDPGEQLMTDEIFGPILPIIAVENLDEAIEFVNARPKPLAAYLFTEAKAIRERVISEVSAGGMVVNHLLVQFVSNKLPFGGVGQSGIGAYHGKFGFEEFRGVIAFLLVDAAMKLAAPTVVTDAGAELGFAGVSAARQLGVILLICTVIHVVPRTSVLGAILLTGYLGGTVATQMRVHAPVLSTVLFGVYLGVLLWGGLWCRDARVRALVPLRSTINGDHNDAP